MSLRQQKLLPCFIAFLSVVVGLSDARADEGFTNRLPDSTVAVVHLDLESIDIEGISNVFPAEARETFKMQVAPVMGMLSSAGMKDLYCTLDLASMIPPKPVFVTNQGVKNAGILQQLLGPAFQGMYGEQFVFESQMIDGRSYTGTPQGLKRFQAPTGTIDLSATFESELDHVVLLQWNKETAETLSQFWPPMLPIRGRNRSSTRQACNGGQSRRSGVFVATQ